MSPDIESALIFSRNRRSFLAPLAVLVLITLALSQFGCSDSPDKEQPSGSLPASTSAPAEQSASAPADSAAAASGDKTSLTNPPRIEWSLTVGVVFWSGVIFMIALLTIKYLTRFMELIAERWVNARLLIKGLIPVVRILGWTLVIYIILVKILHPPIETLLAFTASAGIAIGFAAQDILKNVFGGIMIILDRPFQIGDKIEVSGHYGEVKQIGLRTVRIVTPDDNTVSIPNGEIMNQVVSNANAGERNCQVVAEFYLPADIDLVKAKQIAYRAAAVSRYVYLNKPIAIVFKNEVHEGRSLVKMRLKAYVLDLPYEFPFASEMTEIVIREFLKAKLISPQDLSFQKT